MTDQPTNGDEPDNMLPIVQQSTGASDQGSVQDDQDDEEQPIPQGRALVALPGEASDSDLIEKEWVDKAKQIVEHTAADPFKMQEELSKVKADYIKKRYNKDLGAS